MWWRKTWERIPLVTHPCPTLHPPILRRIYVVPRALDLVRVTTVALIGLDPLAWLKEVPQNLAENFYVSELTSKVGTLNPHQVPHQDHVDAQLEAEGGLPCILVGRKGVSLLYKSLLRDSEVCTIHGHCAVVAYIVGTKPALKDYLCLRGAAAGGGCEDAVEKKIDNSCILR